MEKPLEPFSQEMQIVWTTIGGKPAYVDLGVVGKTFLLCVEFGTRDI